MEIKELLISFITGIAFLGVPLSIVSLFLAESLIRAIGERSACIEKYEKVLFVSAHIFLFVLSASWLGAKYIL